MNFFKSSDNNVKSIMYIHFFCIVMILCNFFKSLRTIPLFFFSFLFYGFFSSIRLVNYKYSLKINKNIAEKLLHCCLILIVIVLISSGDFLSDPLEMSMKFIYMITKKNTLNALFMITGFLSIVYLLMDICIYSFKQNSDDKDIIKVANDNGIKEIKRVKFIFSYVKYELISTFLFIILDCNCDWIVLLGVLILSFWILPKLKNLKEELEDKLFEIKVRHIMEFKDEK